MKECIKCHHILPLTNEFFGIRTDSPDGFRNDCKECVKKRRDAWHIKNRDDQLQKMKEYRLDHRDHLISVQREYNKENRDMIIKRCHIYYESNRDNILAQMKEYRVTNKERISDRRKKRRKEDHERIMQVSHKYKERNEERIRDNHRRYCAKKRKHDPMYRILANLRSRISCALKNGYKSNRTETLIGCSILQLADHLSEHFQPGMSMENYGQWHVDHKTPCAFFDLSKSTQQRKCFNYTNLQPLWAKDNLRKGSKLLYEVTK